MKCATIGCKASATVKLTYLFLNDEPMTDNVCDECADAYGRRIAMRILSREPIVLRTGTAGLAPNFTGGWLLYGPRGSVVIERAKLSRGAGWQARVITFRQDVADEMRAIPTHQQTVITASRLLRVVADFSRDYLADN